MRKACALAFLVFLAAPLLHAQALDATGWHSGTISITDGWRAHEGDDPAWAAPNFDDSAWKTVEIDDMGPSQLGWRWYRLHVKLAPDHPAIHILAAGGQGTYELYVNGERMAEASLLSQFGVERPTEQVFFIGKGQTDLELALRTHALIAYTGWHLPLFLDFRLGQPDSIDNVRASLQSQRLYAFLPALGINLLLILAGIGSFALFRTQPAHKEYLWLGLYLFLLGLSNLLLTSATSGVIPLIFDNTVGDPLVYFFTIVQIEFTFSFTGQRLGRVWRAYEVLLAAMLFANWLANDAGVLSTSKYVEIQALVVMPAALVLPVLLFIWYRRGNHDAGWLILPSLLPTATTAISDLGDASLYAGWGKLDFLANPIPVGVVSLQPSDIGDFLFLLAIGVVMFFRFNRVSREQARSAAELDAAREIQRRMVPEHLPEVAGFAIESAYLPAAEVGGDFYQVLHQSDGSTLIVVGDVSGKGLQAAMTGTLAIGALRTLAAEGRGPAELLTRLNEQIVSTQEAGFITCVCVRIEPDGTITAANAGHLIPYRNGAEIVMDSGLPLGISLDSEYLEMSFVLSPGDQMTLLSDGVVEAMNAKGELFGFERTQEISKAHAEEIADTAKRFGQQDDITVLTVARAGVMHA